MTRSESRLGKLTANTEKWRCKEQMKTVSEWLNTRTTATLKEATVVGAN